jgi:hypothetical protein
MLVLLALVASFLVAVASAPKAASAAPAAGTAGTVAFQHRDYDVHIQHNGDVAIAEHWQVQFTGGPFQHASVSVYLMHTNGVDFGQVDGATSGSQHVTDSIDTNGNSIRKVEWDFPTTSDALRSFTIPYTVHGHIEVNATQAWLDWHFLDGNNRSNTPVMASQITETLPAPPSRALQIKADYPGQHPTTSTPAADSAQVSGQNLNTGKSLETLIIFPREELDASLQRAPWQQHDTPPNLPTALGTGQPAATHPTDGSATLVAAFLDNIWLVLALGFVIIAILGFIAWRLSRRVNAGLRELAALRAAGGAASELDEESPFVTKPLPAINLDFGAVEWPHQHEELDLDALGLHPLDTGKHGPISRVGEPWDERGDKRDSSEVERGGDAGGPS